MWPRGEFVNSFSEGEMGGFFLFDKARQGHVYAESEARGNSPDKTASFGQQLGM